MDKEAIVLIIAQNGLKTAAALLATKAAKLEKQADKAKVKETSDKLRKSAAKTKKLAAVLGASDEGITAYLREIAEA